MKMKAPRVDPTPRTYPDYLARQRQTAMFKQLAKPAKLTPASAQKIRSKASKILGS